MKWCNTVRPEHNDSYMCLGNGEWYALISPFELQLSAEST